MDDLNASTADGAIVDLYDCNGSPAQSWQIMSDGTIQISGKCLDVSGGGTANGTKVQLYTCNGTGAQQWKYVGIALQNPQSGRCLDDPAGSTANGTQLLIYDCHSGDNQAWQIPSDNGVTFSYPGGDLVASIDDGGVPPGDNAAGHQHLLAPVARGSRREQFTELQLQRAYLAEHGHDGSL